MTIRRAHFKNHLGKASSGIPCAVHEIGLSASGLGMKIIFTSRRAMGGLFLPPDDTPANAMLASTSIFPDCRSFAVRISGGHISDASSGAAALTSGDFLPFFIFSATSVVAGVMHELILIRSMSRWLGAGVYIGTMSANAINATKMRLTV